MPDTMYSKSVAPYTMYSKSVAPDTMYSAIFSLEFGSFTNRKHCKQKRIIAK